MAVVFVLFGGKIPPGKLVKRFTGDEAFWIFETIVVDGDRLKNSNLVFNFENKFLRWWILNKCWNNGIQTLKKRKIRIFKNIYFRNHIPNCHYWQKLGSYDRVILNTMYSFFFATDSSIRKKE